MFLPLSSFFHRYRNSLLILFAVAVVLALFSHGRIPQIATYHDFADQCAWLGLPHAENVLSNIPFLFVGLWGLARLRHYSIISLTERLAWAGFFTGVALTAIGSSYYHLQPDNFRLVWDRLPIIFSFSCLFVAVIAERVSERFAAMSLLPMLIYSVISVVYWYFSEKIGLGDMRPYILVQLLPIIMLPIILLLYRSPYTHQWMLLVVALWYVLAKIFEGLDGLVYQMNGLVGGHAIKHILAAMACVQVIWLLERRKNYVGASNR